jgi:hypothetical protein
MSFIKSIVTSDENTISSIDLGVKIFSKSLNIIFFLLKLSFELRADISLPPIALGR